MILLRKFYQKIAQGGNEMHSMYNDYHKDIFNSYEENYMAVCEAKGLIYTQQEFQKYKTTLKKIYHAVCIDIDNTITYQSRSEKKDIIEIFTNLTIKNVPICFITGRGKPNALEFITGLKGSIMNSNKNIKESHFRRWHCVTNNGYAIYSNDFLKNNEFLSRVKYLVDSTIRKSYVSLRYEMKTTIIALLSFELNIPSKAIEDASAKSSNDNNLRFPFEESYMSSITDNLLDQVKTIVHNYNTNFGVSKGIYQKNNKIVIEISMTTKGQAIKTVGEYLGIPEERILRIGDQGSCFGNDYEMLNCNNGFSVGTFSKDANVCYPIAYYGEIITGPTATAQLLSTLKIFPTICLETPHKETYLHKLAKSESNSNAINRETYAYYETLLRIAFKNDMNFFINAWDYMDVHTGGFIIHDWEYYLLKAENPNHILFEIYDATILSSKSKSPMLKFALKTDTGLLLRGPHNYYYGLSNRNEIYTINKKFVKKLNEYRINFMKRCIYSIENNLYLDMTKTINRRVLLGIMDFIRDYLLLFINMQLQNILGNKDALYIYTKNNYEIYELYELAKQNLIFMYGCLFENLNNKFIGNLLTFLRDILIVAKKNQQFIIDLDDTFDYKNGCRVYREIDSFYENVVAIDTSIQSLMGEQDIDNKHLLFYGIRYGSIEMPIITAMLLETKYKHYNLSYKVGIMCLKTDYKNNHSNKLNAPRNVSIYNIKNSHSSKYLHVLMDDNLATGKTIQLAINMLVNKAIYPYKVFVVRYPALNRIQHMFLPFHGAPDTELFWEFIYGLTSPTPYVRLNNPYSYKLSPEEPYLDEIGEFNKTRSYICDILFKNGLFSIKSEVDRTFQV